MFPIRNRLDRAALFIVLASSVVLQAAEPVPVNPPVLPSQFAGWQATGSITRSSDPADADAANAPVLKEYGFQSLEKATYTRDDGRKLAIKAAVFADASGAYGAFTYYKNPDMLNEKIGGQASSLGNRVLFYQNNVLVDAVFDRLSVMSAAELRELAGMLPAPAANARNLPTLPTYLPKHSYQKNTAKYVLGPVTLDHVGAPLPTSMVDFQSGAEVVIGKYSANAGDATLMLISYPTPQLAAEKLKQIEALHSPTFQPEPGKAPALLDIGPFVDKRTGPIIVIAAGPLSANEAKSLLAPISYEADVTWNENTYLTKKDNVANFLFNAILLSGIVVGLALVAGVAFGGVRLLIKRLLPNRIFDRPDNLEIISLHLGESLEQAERRR